MFKHLSLAALVPSPLNTRTDFSGVDELALSLTQHGQFAPLVVRPTTPDKIGDRFEVICGHTRLLAALKAGLTGLDCVVRDYTDEEAIVVMALENLQRQNLNPLEEAATYQMLILKGGRTLEEVARERMTDLRTIADRMRLLRLVDAAKAMVAEGRLPVDHALELAKLPHDVQEEALQYGLWRYAGHGVDDEDFEGSLGLEDKYGDVLTSLVEFKAWVRNRVAFDAVAVPEDLPLLFPEAAAALEGAKLRDEKVLYVSYDRSLSSSITEGRDRVRLVGTWQRADGEQGSLSCEYAQPAVVPGGTHRGRALLVCVAHRKCRTHWRDRIEASERKKAQASEPEKAVAPAGPTQAELERRRIVNAKQPILEAIVKEVRRLPMRPLRERAIDYLELKATMRKHKMDANNEADVLRAVLLNDVDNHSSDYDAAYNLPRLAKLYGVDIRPIVKAANGDAPAKPKARKAVAKKSAKAKKGARR